MCYIPKLIMNRQQKISEGFHKCTGVKGAADKIEQMCK